MEYWCHICKREIEISEHFNCLLCQKPFVEQIEPPEHADEHPRAFVPYIWGSRGRMVTELVFMSSHRPFRSFRSLGEQGEPDSSFDALIHYLMQNDSNRYGPPPASKESLTSLPEVIISEQTIFLRGTRHHGVDEFGCQIDQSKTMIECSVCKEELNVGDFAVSMPCNHLFHKICILSWLEAHNNCPVCRMELPTDDVDYEARKLRK